MKEVEAHAKNDHWVLVKRKEVPEQKPGIVCNIMDSYVDSLVPAQKHTPISLGYALQEKSQHRLGQRSQGWVKHTKRPSLWCQLIINLCLSCDMVCYVIRLLYHL